MCALAPGRRPLALRLGCGRPVSRGSCIAAGYRHIAVKGLQANRGCHHIAIYCQVGGQHAKFVNRCTACMRILRSRCSYAALTLSCRKDFWGCSNRFVAVLLG